jgi:hypothetical protein
MSKEDDPTYSFGNGSLYKAERHMMVVRDGLEPPFKWTTDAVYLRRPQINQDDYYQALEDINDTFTVIADPDDPSMVFEVAVANIDASQDDGIDAEMSTFTSSISGNVGNAVEFAENAALHPDRQRIYLASFGNGRSSYWSADEQRYVRENGRFTTDDGEALPTLESLARALKASDYIITRFSTNSMGGAYATGLMATLPEGQVDAAYLKSRPNISHHPLSVLWGLAMPIKDLIDDRRFAKESNDPWKLTSEKVKEAESLLPNVYSDAARNKHRSFAQKAASSHKIGKMLTDLKALSLGEGNPAAQDTVRALQQQPEALITHHMPYADRLYDDLPADAIRYLTATYDLGKTVTTGQVEVLMMPGAHRDHTQYPGLRWAAEEYAFDRTG